MTSRRQLLSAALLALLVARSVTAQDGERTRRTCRVGHVTEADAPVVDGDLDDPCWAGAPAIGALVMVEPVEGAVPTQRTEVRLLQDRDNLYFALWCDDDDPGSIRATQRARDARLDPDDRVEILLDPFENRRTAYFFQIGAGGSIGDGLSSHNGTRFDKPWDTIFDGAARITARGWQAEVVIPFRSIPRRPGATSWGFNLRRLKRSTGEEYQWTNAVQNVPFFRISEAGTIEGFGEISDGLGIDVVPYGALSVRRDRADADDGWKVDPDAGFDVFYRVTPEMTLALTAFTDFAETEDDSRQINLDRFPLFFPEKRDFFLQGAGYFEFGAGGGDVLPFFSRRIGLDDAGGVVPILGGLKLTGETGPLEVGVLAVVTEGRGVLEQEELAVARLRYSLEEQTAIGIIATAGDPEPDSDNQTGGVDFYQLWPHFVGDLDLELVASALGSHTRSGGADTDGYDFDVNARSRGREWDVQLDARWTSEGFDPALGFVRRTGVRRFRLQPSYEPRLDDAGPWRSLVFDTTAAWVQSWNGETSELEFGFDRIGIRSHEGDSFGFIVRRLYDRIDADFTLFDDTVTISAGDYWALRYGLAFGTSDGRDLSVIASWTAGDFFDGESDEIGVDVQLRTNALLQVGVGYETAIVELGPGRDFTTQIGELRAELHFSPRLNLQSLMLYDNESRQLGWQSRLRWTATPGSDMFAVVSTGWDRRTDGSMVPTTQDLTLKLQHTLRF